MMNLTYMSLQIMSMTTMSPFYVISHHYSAATRTTFCNSYFNHFFSNVVISYTNHHETVIRKTIFSNSLSTPLIFETLSEGQTTYDHTTIHPDNFTDPNDKHLVFNTNIGNIDIRFCSFINLSSTSKSGGSLLVQQDCTVLIHSSTFSGSKTSQNRGGAIAVVKSFNETEDALIKDEQISLLNVQYCCFSGCYPNGEEDKLYGLALFSAAKTTIFYFSSTVNCPPSGCKRSGGAQIDMQAEFIKSKNINITGGYSKFCAGIEYRYPQDGHFKFQSISNISECMFATSMTDVNFANLEMSFSNFDNIRLVRFAADNDIFLYPGVIHVKFFNNSKSEKITIQRMCFTNFIDASEEGSSKVISRGTRFIPNTSENRQQKIYINVVDCIADNTINLNNLAVPTVDGILMLTANITFVDNPAKNKIDQLLLDECIGNFVPGSDVIIEGFNEPTEKFTESQLFSESHDFSQTKDFSDSFDFSNSNKFTKSNVFSNSNDFSETNSFTKTSDFTGTNQFSNSKDFISTSVFNQTEDFSHSSSFSNSFYFSESMKFTQSPGFNQTAHFQMTNDFTKSLDFSPSLHFSDSDKFSSNFTRTSDFHPSLSFSSSGIFTESNVFKPTFNFSNSNRFSESLELNQTSTFSNSNDFSDSQFLLPNKNVIININNNEENKISNKTKIGISVGAGAGAAAIAIAAIILLRRRKFNNVNTSDETVNIYNDFAETMVMSNPLNDIMSDDDPFEDEFA